MTDWRVSFSFGGKIIDQRILNLDDPVQFELSGPHGPLAVAEFDPAIFLRGKDKPKIEVIHPKPISEGKSIGRDLKVQSSGSFGKMPRGIIKLRLDYTNLDDARGLGVNS